VSGRFSFLNTVYMILHIGLLLGLLAQWSIYYKVGPVILV